MANIQKFNFLNSVLNIFSDRVSDDSRTDQLTEFAKQYDWDKLFTGVGITGKWNWSANLTSMYEWLDNQFVLVVWWFGLQTCLVYIFYLIYPLFKKNIANDVVLTNAKIILFFWILACGGFAIYVTISTKAVLLLYNPNYWRIRHKQTLLYSIRFISTTKYKDLIK